MYSFVVAPGRQGVIGQSLGVVMEGGGDLQCKVVSLSTGQARLLETISTTLSQCSTTDTNMQRSRCQIDVLTRHVQLQHMQAALRPRGLVMTILPTSPDER